MTTVSVRAYGPLNDFLPAHRRQASWSHVVEGRPSVKDLLESAGIPHPEVDLILINGESAAFDRQVTHGDRIAAFPHFFSIDVAGETRVRPQPLPELRFVADVHLGKLARHLRLAGLDTTYSHDATDDLLAHVAASEGRTLLTRDVGLLKRRVVTHGYYVRDTRPHWQLAEVLRRFMPAPLRPFTRCLRCNGPLARVSKDEVDAELLPNTRAHHDEFQRCTRCQRVYWKGTHWERLKRALEGALLNLTI